MLGCVFVNQECAQATGIAEYLQQPARTRACAGVMLQGMLKAPDCIVSPAVPDDALVHAQLHATLGLFVHRSVQRNMHPA
jgi:hypothetical protein